MKTKPNALTICPKCRSFYSAEMGTRALSCNNCQTELLIVPLNFDKYNALAPDKQAKLRKEYAEKYFSQAAENYEEINGADLPAPRTFYHPLKPSGWSTLMGICGWVCFVVFLLLGVIALVNGEGLIAMVVVLAGAIVSCGAILFNIVADDVRETRSKVEKIQHDMGYKK